LVELINGRQRILLSELQRDSGKQQRQLVPADFGSTNAFLGKSEFAGDRYLKAEIDSVYLGSIADSRLGIKSCATVTNIAFNSESNLNVTLPANSTIKFFRLQWP
jgi:hypothetical protein